MEISKTTKCIGIILAAILAFIQIWEWASNALRNDLVAKISYGEFKLPTASATRAIAFVFKIINAPPVDAMNRFKN